MEIAIETKVKVCGITGTAEVEVLESAGVDFAGLWYGVPGGPSDLSLERWIELAAATERVAPVMVTFLKDAGAMREALAPSGVGWVQLHGYQTPGLVRALKRDDPELRVIKVLHVRDRECLEGSLIETYESAGVDIFLFDAVSADGRIGSTGQTLDPDLVTTLADRLERPFLLAGGLSADNAPDYRAVAAHSGFFGIDVDTNARGPDGSIRAENVEAIERAWRGSASGGASDD